MNTALRQLEALLANAAAEQPRFPANSRYNALPVLEHKTADGRVVTYVARRFIPAPDPLAVAREHSVIQGERLDLLAHNYVSDSEQWWKIADANVALVPETLTDEPGRILAIAIAGLPTGRSGL